MAARAQIFRRDAGKVVDLASLKAIMRSNDYKNDPIAHGNPMRAICSRNDLNPGGVPEGCYDTKVTNAAMAMSLRSQAINGPTRGANGDTYKPFYWTPVLGTYYSFY